MSMRGRPPARPPARTARSAAAWGWLTLAVVVVVAAALVLVTGVESGAGETVAVFVPPGGLPPSAVPSTAPSARPSPPGAQGALDACVAADLARMSLPVQA